ncbi:MAG TPA: hypothetical protein VIA82_06275 [Candidatus Limnocylindria bacterium]
MSQPHTDEALSQQAQPERSEPPMDQTWAYGMPYTVQFPDGGGQAEADLEHPAHLPRVGDIVEYINERGECRRYRVREVVHTLQSSAAYRPTVADVGSSPDALARPDETEPAELPGASARFAPDCQKSSWKPQRHSSVEPVLGTPAAA